MRSYTVCEEVIYVCFGSIKLVVFFKQNCSQVELLNCQQQRRVSVESLWEKWKKPLEVVSVMRTCRITSLTPVGQTGFKNIHSFSLENNKKRKKKTVAACHKKRGKKNKKWELKKHPAHINAQSSRGWERAGAPPPCRKIRFSPSVRDCSQQKQQNTNRGKLRGGVGLAF